MKNFIKLGALVTIITIALVTGVVFFTKPSVQVALAVNTQPCNVVPSHLSLDVTESVVNDTDSGNHGNWAIDSFSRHLQIWSVGYGEDSVYCGQVTDNGTFVTLDSLSPNAGATLSAGITGTFTGGAKFRIHGYKKGDWDDIKLSTLDCSVAKECDGGTLHALLSNYFDRESHDYLNWGWTYTTCQNGTWADTSTNSDGSLPADGDITNTLVTNTCPTSQDQGNNNGGGNSPTFAGSSTEAPVCGDGNTVQLPANAHVVRSGSQATVNFFITEGDSANIYYRVVGQSDWQYSVVDVKPNSDNFVSYTISGLDPQLGYDFGVQQKHGCGGGQLVTAVIVDGPINVTFPFSYWEWSK